MRKENVLSLIDLILLEPWTICKTIEPVIIDVIISTSLNVKHVNPLSNYPGVDSSNGNYAKPTQSTLFKDKQR